MQLRGLRDAVRHARAAGPDARYRGRDDEGAAVGVRGEGRQGRLHEVRLRAHVHGEAGVPVGGGGRGEVAEGAEAGVALRRGGLLELLWDDWPGGGEGGWRRTTYGVRDYDI